MGKASRPASRILLGFGANMITVAAVVVLGVNKRNATTTRNIRIGLLGKVFLHILPAFGACLSFYEMFLLMKSSLEGHNVEYHDWLFRCSQFASWMTILLVSNFSYWFHVFCNPILCFWWILKPVLEIPLLLTKFSSLEVITCLKESSSIFAEFMFGLFVIVVKAMHASNEEREFDSIEDPLLPRDSVANKNHIIDADWKFSSCFDLVTFKFVNLMMDLGVTKQLDFKDLVELPCDLMPSSCHHTLMRGWVAEQNKHNSNPSLFRAMCYAYGWPYLRLGLLKAINDCVGFISPLLLNKLIKFLQQGSGDVDGYFLALSLGFTSILKSFLDTQYTFRLGKLKLMLRSSIMIILYRKCLFISQAERSIFSDGEVQTFMSIDADRTANLCNSLHDVWSLPLQIGVALYLLYTQVSFAFVSGVAITILLIPVNKWISTMIASATEKMMKQKDERIRGAGELITYIRTLKMYSWEHLFTKRLMERRAMEVQHLSTRKYLDAWCVFFWATTPTLFSLFTFGVFALMGHSLSAATVFTCVALFNTLISPLNSFPWVINGLIDAMISSRRLSKYLSCPEHNSECEQSSGGRLNTYGPSPCLFESEVDAGANPKAIVFQNASCVWSSSYEVGNSVILDGISLDFPKGIFVAIIGEVGSGKSSLLNSILGEMHLIRGVIQACGSIAYVPQVPWIQSGSVRDNILFGKEYDARRYREVLQACALDIDISLMIGGDLAYIGEKGVNLSGGQRARLALARAVYCDSDIYLLDDILSAVDSQVACWILQRTILGPLMNQKTRVLCTHNVQAISSADMIVIMDRGHVKWAGMSANFLVSPYLATYVPNNSKFPSSQLLGKESMICASDELRSNVLLESGFVATSEEAQETAETEFRKEGRVELSVYKSYATFASWPVVFVICVSAFFMQASRNGNDLWLSHWVDNTTGTENTRFYLVILSIFGLVNSLFTLARAFSFSYGGLRAAVQVHTKLLNKLVDAPVHFFDQNPSGRILNRLSSDLYTLDDSLPFILNILLANFYSLLGIVVVLSYVQIIFLLLLFPLWYVYRKLQFYYRSTSRELRRLDSVSRSPIYSCFTETLDGSSTIRAFRKEEFFLARFMEHITLYQQTSYSERTASLWLSLRLQLLAAFVILFIAVMAVVGCRGNFPLSFGTPGLVGLALSYAAPVVSLLSSFLTSFTETEKEMVSVERVVEYMDIPQEGLQGSRSVHPEWPMQGQIEFEHVTLRYKPSLPAALNDVSFYIAAGMQVGVVGRTGAGKSSLLNALFRLTPICNGHILVDGVDVADISVRNLRGHFAVVPQSPFLFEGSLRENLDPSGMTTDEKIWEALQKCHIKAEIELAGGLDLPVKESGTSFSVGQWQLICLARAIVKSSKILCLDECTANVDTQTAMILQNTISNECKGMTVLTIAHRISTVLSMDEILILDHGNLVEQGNPQVLLKDEYSRFSSFARASTM
ncbi:ABC transporter C family member 13-like isoform X1 [Phoenix dactylifera]|uniref:ABC-type xenobiotic transporter n=3 Tax=Phoenix dactylifera TaxID=42345 RepID=A0A8B9AEG3_PHODC|nr:ABC transporter C family member 13-like isoform X1 [Phoenix dactylifera]